MSKPLLFLDVDGPLNPYDAKPERRPEGYGTHRLVRHWRLGKFDGPRWGAPGERGMRVWLNPAHGPMLLKISDAVDLVWATAWGHLANEFVSPMIGLPTDLPTVLFEPGVTTPNKIWKRDTVEAYADGREFAWFDDEFEPGDLAWGAARSAAGVATLLYPIDPKVGIVQGDVDAVAAWATPRSKRCL